MTDERETAAMAIKFIYRRSGRDTMTREEIVLSISANQKWLSPEEAADFLKACLGKGLVKESSDGEISMSSDVADIDLPALAFNPDIEQMKGWARKRDLFQSTVDMVVGQTKMKKKEVIADANRIKGRLNVDIKVALLIVAMKRGLDVSGLADEIERDLVERRINEEKSS